MFVVSLSYKVDLSKVDQYIEEYVAFLETYYEAGVFLASGRKVPRTGGVILAQAKNRQALMDILHQDPFHREGLADYQVTEFIPNKVAKGFEALLEPVS